MNEKKLSPELNLALELTQEMREKSLDLNVGFDSFFEEWELIIRYTGNIQPIRVALNIEIEELYGGYGILRIPWYLIGRLSQFSQIDYIEKPKYMIENQWSAVEQSCGSFSQLAANPANGAGVLVACIDTGVDIYHELFRRADGTTRIKLLWDQTIQGNPPEGFYQGSVYTEDDINELLIRGNSNNKSLSFDENGHGTAVLGIMMQMAPEAEYIVVKMGSPMKRGFPRTTHFMLGMEFANRMAISLGMPIVYNISYGNNYGAHNGSSLLEQYVNGIANQYQTTIVAGAGNEGISGRHAVVHMERNQNEERAIYVSEYLKSFNLQIWTEGEEDVDIYLKSPSGKQVGPITMATTSVQYSFEKEDVMIWYGSATPYNRQREIYMAWIPKENYITSGIWEVQLISKRTAKANLWLPVSGSTTSEVFFVDSDVYNTIVMPATATGVISVAAYNGNTDTYAAFSGRGDQVNSGNIKPDLVAPGVNVISATNGGRYGEYTGTSFAAPFVTGAAALLMSWGIVIGNDPYMFGEKVRIQLIRGARTLPFQEKIPSPEVGWGALCVAKSFPN